MPKRSNCNRPGCYRRCLSPEEHMWECPDCGAGLGQGRPHLPDCEPLEPETLAAFAALEYDAQERGDAAW